MRGPIDEFAERVAVALQAGMFSERERRELCAGVESDLRDLFGEASPTTRIRATCETESVKLSTGFGEARNVGRAAPSDCKTQLLRAPRARAT